LAERRTTVAAAEKISPDQSICVTPLQGHGERLQSCHGGATPRRLKKQTTGSFHRLKIRGRSLQEKGQRLDWLEILRLERAMAQLTSVCHMG